MVCNNITFHSFRNIADEKCYLSNGVNILWGENAQGKSNMLEGIYFFARGRSFRGAKEKELISFSEKSLSIGMEFKRDLDNFPINLEINIPQDGKKEIFRNGAHLSGIKEMIGSFRAVLFCPGHLSLVSGAPSVRRSFLDIALSQLYPGYVDSLSRYNKILLQRNALIKEARNKNIDNGIWDVYAIQLSSLAEDITKKRQEYILSLETAVKAFFSEMTDDKESPTLRFRTSVINDNGENTLYSQLTENLDREIAIGATFFGCHKDDISIKINEKDARTYASQGQQRSMALAMKLAEGEISKKIGGEYPVFLLDDVMSELDENRRAFILSKLEERQIIITSCEPDIFISKSIPVNLLQINNGKIINNN